MNFMLLSFQYHNFNIKSKINLSSFLHIFLTQIFISRRRNYKWTTSWLLWDSIIICLPIKMLSILYPPVPSKCRTVVSKTAVCTGRRQAVWHSLNSLHNENHIHTLQGYKAHMLPSTHSQRLWMFRWQWLLLSGADNLHSVPHYLQIICY